MHLCLGPEPKVRFLPSCISYIFLFFSSYVSYSILTLPLSPPVLLAWRCWYDESSLFLVGFSDRCSLIHPAEVGQSAEFICTLIYSTAPLSFFLSVFFIKADSLLFDPISFVSRASIILAIKHMKRLKVDHCSAHISFSF